MSIKLKILNDEAQSSLDDETAGGADDGDTSFEIDDPEDEEVLEPTPVLHNRLGIGGGGGVVGHTSGPPDPPVTLKTPPAPSKAASAAAACTCSIVARALRSSTRPEDSPCLACAQSTLTRCSVPVVYVQDDDDDDNDDDDDDDDQSDEAESSAESSHTASSTPTTADVADVSVQAHNEKLKVATLAARAAQSQNQYLASAGSGSGGGAAEDNLSASIATTTTEVDLDAVASVSPNTMQRIMRLQQQQQLQQQPPQHQQLQLQDTGRPSAALRQTHVGSSEGLGSSASASAYGRPPLDPGHQRTLSSSSYRSVGSHASHTSQSLPAVQTREPKMWLFALVRWICQHFKSSGIGEPSVYHALVVIFLEFFAWGLLTMPLISVLNQTFPDHTFLMNGLVMGIKGILSFLSAPLIGALSDIWGRKFFLLITVFFTCAPIPLMTINTWWFFAMISISGVFAVTFSVVFAYVADVTTVEERSRAYGLVSATFAASLVISPALGAALMEMYSDTLVVALATAIAVLDVFFILVAVPESLPEKVRPSSWGAPISWEQADPFAALRKVGTDHTILMQCVTVLLSYLPEAGQYSCIFVYLKLKMGFNSMEVAIFIAVVGILSISVQVTLGYLMRVVGAKRTIILGLVLEMMQLLWYGFGSQSWMMWAAGVLAALGSITYPAISAFVSIHSNADQQGAVQGMVTGMRGLCNGLGPAMFGVIFYLFNVDLNDEHSLASSAADGVHNETVGSEMFKQMVPGPPFAFGALMVILAILVAAFIPEAPGSEMSLSRAPSEKKRVSLDVQYEIECGHKSTSPLAPLMRSDSLAQL